jgi:hypothetical protein
MPSDYDPMGGHRFSLATNAERVCAEIMLKTKSGYAAIALSAMAAEA